MEKFQISLAAARVNANMTQEDTARAMKVSKTTIVNGRKEKIIPEFQKLKCWHVYMEFLKIIFFTLLFY